MLKLKELINIDSVKKMAENIYAIFRMPMGIVGADGTIEIAVGWQDICTKYHRQHKTTCTNCITSDEYLKKNINKDEHIAHKCLNNMWDIAIPIYISEIHIATVFLGQFFYNDEVIDIEYFRKQAQKFGFN